MIKSDENGCFSVIDTFNVLGQSKIMKSIVWQFVVTPLAGSWDFGHG